MQQAEYMSVPTAAELKSARAAEARRWELAATAAKVAAGVAAAVAFLWTVYGAWLMQGAEEMVKGSGF